MNQKWPFAVALWVLLVFTEQAGAQLASSNTSVPQAHWPWERFSTWEYAVSGAAIAGTLVVTLAVPSPSTPNWRGGILIDENIRDLLRVSSSSGRRAAATVSDILVWTLLAYPLLDAAWTWGVHKSPDSAFQLFLIDVQSYAVTFFATELTKRAVGRERPEKHACNLNVNPANCEISSPYDSFFSGHSSRAFTAAGLVCSQHINASLYGNALADGFACGATLTAATATGVLRVAADKHYLTDVLVGGAVGMSSGYLLPVFLHFNRPHKRDSSLTPVFLRMTWYSGGPFVAFLGAL
jgi:membrane-associated phospholipid phosphatase